MHSHGSTNPVFDTYYHASSAPQYHTQTVVIDSIRAAYPDRLITTTPLYQCDFLEYDQSIFRKDKELYASAMKVGWEDVILSEDTKKAVKRDVNRFFDGREMYESLGAPWKRGILYYGPPGNGKTMTIKAIMHTLYSRPTPIPTLYVKSFASYSGPQRAIRSIFEKARSLAPCLLIMEDLDTLVTPDVRSYFFNEVDGLESNSGILMLGTTNHLEWLDPGLSKRPSRFDRKYLFPLPNFGQRVEYCQYWRHRLRNNDTIEFPTKLSAAIAKITWDFSFAYIQEAFVAALLVIAGGEEEDCIDSETFQREELPKYETLAPKKDQDAAVRDDHSKDPIDDGELDKLILWREIKRQVKTLREEMNGENSKLYAQSLRNSFMPPLAKTYTELACRGPKRRGLWGTPGGEPGPDHDGWAMLAAHYARMGPLGAGKMGSMGADHGPGKMGSLGADKMGSMGAEHHGPGMMGSPLGAGRMGSFGAEHHGPGMMGSPLGAGRMDSPLGPGRMDPLGAGMMDPSGAERMGPLTAFRMQSLAAGNVGPLGAGSMGPLGTGRMDPSEAGSTSPLGPGRMDPLNAALPHMPDSIDSRSINGVGPRVWGL